MAGLSGRDFGKIIVIGRAEGFLAGGLISKLDQTGIAAEAVGTDIKRIEALKDEAELYIAFADEGVEDESECLVFLKDVASDTDRRIIVIGNAESIEQVKKTKIPILFIHGSEDNFVNTNMVYSLYDACPTQKDIMVVEGAGHGQSLYLDPETYFNKVFGFIESL